MPANSGDVDNVYFYSIRLGSDRSDPDPESLSELFFKYHIPEFLYAIDPYGHHEIFREFFPIEMLQNEIAAVGAETGHAAGIPVEGETELLEE